jgi:hypothetical protein
MLPLQITLAVVSLLARHANAQEKEAMEMADLFIREPDEPPRGYADARFDLPFDMSGQWGREMGNGLTMNQWIWQECLEVTISGNASRNGTTMMSAPLHHMIANGKYVTFDDTGTTVTGHEGILAYKAIIAAPTRAEAADGASATLVFFADAALDGFNQTTTVELAIRYIDQQGRLTFQQNSSTIQGAAALQKMTKVNDVLCPHAHTAPISQYCNEKDYSTDLHNSFTPACCKDGYHGSTALHTAIAAPVWMKYVADCSSGTVPTITAPLAATATPVGTAVAIASGANNGSPNHSSGVWCSVLFLVAALGSSWV